MPVPYKHMNVSKIFDKDGPIAKAMPGYEVRHEQIEMAEAVEKLDFETAALIRDELYKLEGTDPKIKKPRARKPLSGN